MYMLISMFTKLCPKKCAHIQSSESHVCLKAYLRKKEIKAHMHSSVLLFNARDNAYGWFLNPLERNKWVHFIFLVRIPGAGSLPRGAMHVMPSRLLCRVADSTAATTPACVSVAEPLAFQLDETFEFVCLNEAAEAISLGGILVLCVVTFLAIESILLAMNWHVKFRLR
jgi:hypothetical protein